jgi:hypothetical protein
MFIIPTSPEPNQVFRCVIPVDGRSLALMFSLKFNTEARYWVMSLTGDVTGEMLIDSIPLIAGRYPSANILGQYAFLGIGSAVIVKTNPDNPAFTPDETNLGTEFQLVWSDTIYE